MSRAIDLGEKHTPLTLSQKVDQVRKEIRTDDYPMSIGEWVSLYESGDLDIHPEFQRFFRWTDEQKSNLIESILLGIPLPPIFVSQRADGVWDVVDGLQRLSTIFQLMGILKNEEDQPVKPLTLHSTKYLPEMAGMTWDSENADKEISADLKRVLKRSKIHVSIVLKESDERAKYDLFQRLNTGGSQLSPQEVRNCILVMVNREFYFWLKRLSQTPSFQSTIALSEKPLQEAYDLELCLRFLLFVRAPEDELASVGDVGVYFTDKVVEVASSGNFDYEGWEGLFTATFDLLDQRLGDAAFKKYNYNKGRHEGGFIVSQYEVVTSGVAHNLERGTLADDLAERIAGIWNERNYTEWAGSGITAARRLRRLVPFAREYFRSR